MPIPTPTSTRSGGTSWSGTSRCGDPTTGTSPTGHRRSTSPWRPSTTRTTCTGELFASQLDATLTDRAGGLVDRRVAGELLVRDVFGPGASLRWDDLVIRATGEPLSAAHLARELAA